MFEPVKPQSDRSWEAADLVASPAQRVYLPHSGTTAAEPSHGDTFAPAKLGDPNDALQLAKLYSDVTLPHMSGEDTVGVTPDAYHQVLGNHARGIIAPTRGNRTEDGGKILGALRSRDTGKPAIIVGISPDRKVVYRHTGEGRAIDDDRDILAMQQAARQWMKPDSGTA